MTTSMTFLMAFQAATAAAPPSTLSGEATAPVSHKAAPAPAVPTRPSVRAGIPVTTPAVVAPVGVSAEIKVPPSATPRPDRTHVLAAVNAEWKRYDTHGAGRLGPLEFATWVMRANGAAVAPAGIKGAPGVRPVSAMNVTARAFARADANHDGGVTPEEMTDFLMR
jgi:hypothetical protein